MESQPAQPNHPPASTQQLSNQPSSAHKSKILLIILIAIFFLLLGAGVMYAWQNYSQLLFPNISPITQVNPTTAPTVIPSTSSQIPADWKTYTNEQYGYEFKYPEKNRYEPQRLLGDTSPIFCYLLDEKATPKSIKGTACIWPGFISQEELNTMGITYCGSYPKDLRCQSLKFNNEVSFSIDWGVDVPDTNQKKASAWISYPKGGIITIELQPVEPKSKEIFIQILSTFKFTDSTQLGNNTNWKTYTTPKLSQLSFPSVTFKYLPDWNIDEKDDGLGILNLKLSKSGYEVTFYQAAMGGGICLFDDSPNFEGPSSNYRSLKYTEINSNFGILRYFVNPNNSQKYSFCQKSNEYFGSLGIGALEINIPTKTDSKVFQEAIDIVKQITIN